MVYHQQDWVWADSTHTSCSRLCIAPALFALYSTSGDSLGALLGVCQAVRPCSWAPNVTARTFGVSHRQWSIAKALARGESISTALRCAWYASIHLPAKAGLIICCAATEQTTYSILHYSTSSRYCD